MLLKFLGTRGNTQCRARRHRLHSALMVSHRGKRLMIDCGADWLGKVERLEPDAIVLTHAHPDHAWGLASGAPCPVYATQETWNAITYPIEDRRIIVPRAPTPILGIAVEAFPVDHSIRCPAVGYRMTADRTSFFYVPDVVAIRDRAAALRGVDLYIGDGATMTRPMVRRRGRALFGHTPVRTQLGWCEKERVERAVFTHCGTEIVAGDARALGSLIKTLGDASGVAARIAYDGLEIEMPPRTHATARQGIESHA